MLWLMLLAVGALSGLLGGMLGIGGGIIIVPALIILLETLSAMPRELVTVVAVGTSLACITFTSASAAWQQYRAGKVRWDIFRRLVPFFVCGSFAAGFLAPQLPGALLRALIGGFLFIVALIMFADWKPHPDRNLPGVSGSIVVGTSGGLVAGMAGIAGGNVIVPTLVFFNVPIHNATATSSAMGVLIALAGAVSYAASGSVDHSVGLLGHIHWPSWLAVASAAIITAPLGVKLAHRVPAATLKRFFAAFLSIVAVRMLYTATTL